MKTNFYRGATAWEGHIGRLWFRWPFWVYLKLGIRPKIGWEKDED